MKIRINKCTSPSAWYRDRIGQTLPVERYEINRHPSQGIPEDVYWCREGGTYNCINYVRASDATVLENPVPSGNGLGFWRSATGENHGRDSRPGDVWVEPGDITDTDRINWLESGGGETDVFIDRDPKSGTPYAIRLWPKLGPGPQFDGNTLREAIDSAISARLKLTAFRCSNCDHREPKDGFCSIFYKFVEPSHGDKCTAHSLLPCRHAERDSDGCCKKCGRGL